MSSLGDSILKACATRPRRCREVPREIAAFIITRRRISIYEWNLGQYLFDFRLGSRIVALGYHLPGESISSEHCTELNDDIVISEDLVRCGMSVPLFKRIRQELIPLWKEAYAEKHLYTKRFVHENEGKLYMFKVPGKILHYFDKVLFLDCPAFMCIFSILLKTVGFIIGSIVGFVLDFCTMRYFFVSKLMDEYRNKLKNEHPEWLAPARENNIKDKMHLIVRKLEEEGMLSELYSKGIKMEVISGSSEHFIPVAVKGKSNNSHGAGVKLGIKEPMAWGEYLYFGFGFTASEEVIKRYNLDHSISVMDTKLMVAVEKGSKYASHYKHKSHN